MGRINTIYDPINWKIDLEGKSKILEDELDLNNPIAKYEKEPEGIFSKFMSKQNKI